MKRELTWLLLAVALVLVAAPDGQAQITRIEWTRRESPTFGGASFGTVGQFEKLVGVAYGEVDPHHPLNAIIQDIDLAPRNPRGMVEYSMDVYVIKPVDMTRGNGTILYNVVNRGNKGGLGTFNKGVVGGNEPTSAGDGFLQKVGYTIVWSGWQPDVLPGNNRMTMTVPVATNSDGTPITGVVRTEYIVTAAASTQNLGSGWFTALTHSSYETESLDNAGATLTRRVNEGDARELIPNASWKFADCSSVPFPGTPNTTKICLQGGFSPNYIYELTYTAKNPLVLGLGFAATRDLISFFRHGVGTQHPFATMAGAGVQHALMMGISQSGRYVRSFINLGFNEDLDGEIVFEGAMPHIAPGRIPLNVRFGQPGRAYGEHEDHLFPDYESPFTYMPVHDPVAGRTDGILKRCLQTDTCPKIVHIMSSLEYWQGRQSLDQTDALARHDVGLPGFVRMYLMASTQHTSAAAPAPGTLPSRGICRWPANPAPQSETMRAAFVALDAWVNRGVPPPPSQIPTLREHTLVPPDRATLGFPNIPATNYVTPTDPVSFDGIHNGLTLLDFGPDFDARTESGNMTLNPPTLVAGGEYATLVPQVDADGNDIAGIRSTAIRAPLGTYTGWNRRAPGFSADEQCALQGLFIPFATTRAQRLATGDPRLSVEERYGTHAGYVDAVRRAAAELVAERFLLAEDAAALVAEAGGSATLASTTLLQQQGPQPGAAIDEEPSELFFHQRVATSSQPLMRLQGMDVSAAPERPETAPGTLTDLVRQQGVRGLTFSITRTAARSAATIRLYALSGRLVRTLVNERLEPGVYEIAWDGLDDGGRPAAPGVYVARLTIGSYRAVQRLVLRQP